MPALPRDLGGNNLDESVEGRVLIIMQIVTLHYGSSLVFDSSGVYVGSIKTRPKQARSVHAQLTIKNSFQANVAVQVELQKFQAQTVG